MAELFRNRVFGILSAGINASATAMNLTAGHGARFGTIGAGDFIRGSIISSSGQVENVQITARATDQLTIVRAYDGSTGLIFNAGDRIECRIGNSSMSGLAQVADLQTNAKKFSVNTGSANDLIATLPASSQVTLVNGMEVDVELTAANDDVATLKVVLGITDTGVLPVRKQTPLGIVAIVEGDLPAANGRAKFAYDASLNVWVLLNPSNTEFTACGKEYWGNTRPAGYVFFNGQTIGDAASGATARAKADTEALFTALWSSGDDTTLPIQTSAGAPSTRGGSAAADFAAHKRLSLPDKRDRITVGQDNMGGAGDAARITVAIGGVDTTKIAAAGGAQSVVLVQANLPNVTLPNTLAVPFSSTLLQVGGTPQNLVVPGSTGVSGSVTTGGTDTPVNKLPPVIVAPYLGRL